MRSKTPTRHSQSFSVAIAGRFPNTGDPFSVKVITAKNVTLNFDIDASSQQFRPTLDMFRRVTSRLRLRFAKTLLSLYLT
nr:hypothetical protein CFP56_70804 [Quercus suber]